MLAASAIRLTAIELTERDELQSEAILLLSPKSRAAEEARLAKKAKKKASAQRKKQAKLDETEAGRLHLKEAEEELSRARRGQALGSAGFRTAEDEMALNRALAKVEREKKALASEVERQARLKAELRKTAAERKVAEEKAAEEQAAAEKREKKRAYEKRTKERRAAERAAVAAMVERRQTAEAAEKQASGAVLVAESEEERGAALGLLARARELLAKVLADEIEEATQERERLLAETTREAARQAEFAVWQAEFEERQERQEREKAQQYQRERAIAEEMVTLRGESVDSHGPRALDTLSPNTKRTAREQAKAKMEARATRRNVVKLQLEESTIAFAIALAERYVAARAADALA